MKCPNCGEEMQYQPNYTAYYNGNHCYTCPKCPTTVYINPTYYTWQNNKWTTTSY